MNTFHMPRYGEGKIEWHETRKRPEPKKATNGENAASAGVPVSRCMREYLAQDHQPEEWNPAKAAKAAYFDSRYEVNINSEDAHVTVCRWCDAQFQEKWLTKRHEQACPRRPRNQQRHAA